MRLRQRALGTGLVTLLSLAPLAVAQDAPPPPPPPRSAGDAPPPPPGARGEAPTRRIDPTDPAFQGALLGDYNRSETATEQVIVAVGGERQPVWIRLDGLEVRADSVVVWGAPGTLQNALRARRTEQDDERLGADEVLGEVLHALYAEGQVFVQRDGHTIRAERVLFDFRTERAYLVDAHVRGAADRRADGTAVPVSFRADVVRGLARNRYRAEDTVVSTSDYDPPKLGFRTEWLEVDFTEEFARFETAWWPTFFADTALGEETPLLVLPKVGGRTFELRPLQDVDYGNSSRFGAEVQLEWGGSVDVAGEEESVDWTLHTDYRSRRGVGVGLDLRYVPGVQPQRGPRDEFELESRYQHDTADEDDFSERPFDGLLGGSTPDDRGRIDFFGRHSFRRGSVFDGWRLQSQLAYHSDRGYRAEYERRGFLEQDPRESYVQLRGAWGNKGVSAVLSHPLSDEATSLVRDPVDLFRTDYQVQTAYLPSLTYHVIDTPWLRRDQLGGVASLNFSMQASVAHLAREYDEVTADVFSSPAGLGWTRDRVFRGDVEMRWTAPFAIGPVQVTPMGGGSLMDVDEANGFGGGAGRPNDSSEDRYAGVWGVRANVDFHRPFDVSSKLLDVNGLRHVVGFDAQYVDRFRVSEDGRTFQQNDLIDDLDEVRVGIAGMRNRLQTRRDGEVVDWIDHAVRVIHFFDEQRRERRLDHPFGLRENFAQPLQGQDFPGEQRFRNRSRDGYSYMSHRLRVQALPNVWLVGEGDYDAEIREWETTLGGVRWFVTNRLSFYVGRRTIHDDSTIWTGRTDYRISKKWGVSLEHQENSRVDRSLRTTLALYRRAPDWTLSVEAESDDQLDESSLSIAVYLNDWLNDSRRDPFNLRRPLDPQALRWYR